MNPQAMEPLLPERSRAKLATLTCDILQASGKLSGLVHSDLVLEKIASLVREMNCYYSNLIEGHKTKPREIQRALEQEFSGDETQVCNQKLSVAHIEVERLMERRLKDEADVDVYSKEFLCWIHREFYYRLPKSMHFSLTESGEEIPIIPGEMRKMMVDVGRHTPPDFNSLDCFLDRFKSFYGSNEILDTNRVLAIAAAHHRLAWIHPFLDGNGRVIRLHSQALMIKHNLAGHGLWTLSRGLARNRKRYYELLEEADRKRYNDFDGRGNLSDKGLSEFCEFFLDTMLDQIQFMTSLLDLPNLRKRVERYFHYDAMHIKKYRPALMQVVSALIDEGQFERSRVQQLSGKGATVSAEIIKLGIAEGFISSPSPKGLLQINFPEKALIGFFPQLYVDLPVHGK